MVTLLECGSAVAPREFEGGVLGMGGSGVSTRMMAVSSGMSTRESEDSTDLLRDPVREVRRRFRAEISLSPKGLGRVEQGSEETARSVESAEALESRSIWLVQTQMKELQVRLSKLGAFARDGSAACRLRLYQHVGWNAHVGENVRQGRRRE
jgi:hypothetical protein